MSAPRMLANIRTARVTITKFRLVVLVLAAAVAGGVVATRLPIGEVPLSVAKGHAQLTADGDSGSFQADGDVTALLPADVMWTDGGILHQGGRPACLWNANDKDNENTWSRVEAGYRWMRVPGGGSYPLVAWIKCL